MPVPTDFHNLEIDAEQIIAAHARLARHAGRNDHHVRASDSGIVTGAGEMRIKSFDRGRLGEV